MGRSKDLFFELMMKMMMGGERPSLNPMSNEEFKMEDDNSEETFEITKGKIKSIFRVRFNKEGHPVALQYEAQYMPSEEEELENKLMLIRREMEEAVEKEDFLLAAEKKRELEALQKTNVN